MKNEAQLITHYYFCNGVIDRLSNQARTPAELFGDGELELIHNLCRYSQIISEIEHSKNDEEGFPGVFDYEISETLAAQLWIALCEQNPEFEPWDFPEESQFRNLVEQLIDDWLHQRLPRELVIQQ
ncbi:hypothetical protein [Salinisphaera sp. G21_0]|uniref:hypothetical protein n=1 Tax=Salinisphaera sp. G21_0 TaxID=2821094 RepID=UPI001ADC2B86|nr:hypothetical protein [Salinisphaera sp. G21_0]MBO9484125.1 hypothetical protein [Salinisphaera sp. G21_0]